MKWTWVVAVLAFSLVICGCDGTSDKTDKPAPSGGTKTSGTPAKPGEEPAGEMTVKIEPAKATVKAGAELEITGFLLNKPKKLSRWSLATAWDFGDGKRNVWRPDDKAADIRTVGKHAWAKPGTYTVTLEFWNGNDKVIEGTAQVVVE